MIRINSGLSSGLLALHYNNILHLQTIARSWSLNDYQGWLFKFCSEKAQGLSCSLSQWVTIAAAQINSRCGCGSSVWLEGIDSSSEALSDLAVFKGQSSAQWHPQNDLLLETRTTSQLPSPFTYSDDLKPLKHLKSSVRPVKQDLHYCSAHLDTTSLYVILTIYSSFSYFFFFLCPSLTVAPNHCAFSLLSSLKQEGAKTLQVFKSEPCVLEEGLRYTQSNEIRVSPRECCHGVDEGTLQRSDTAGSPTV